MTFALFSDFFPQGFEYRGKKFSLDLTGGVFPLRGQTRSTKLISCQTVEKFRSDVDGEDSVNEGLFWCPCLVILKEVLLEPKQRMLFCPHSLKVLPICID